jgi:hypothetical protein
VIAIVIDDDVVLGMAAVVDTGSKKSGFAKDINFDGVWMWYNSKPEVLKG